MRQRAISIAEIAQAQDRKTLLAAMQAAVGRLGFQVFNLSYNKREVAEFMTAPTLSSLSRDDLEVYHRGEWAERDPLLARAGGAIRDVWTPQDWMASAETREYSEYIGGTGILSGATAQIVMTPGTVGAITALSFTKPTLSRQAADELYIYGQAAALKAAVLGFESIPLPAMTGPLRQLTDRQKVILDWAAQGKSNQDIAVIIRVGKRTVDYHMSEILRKLNVSSRTQAVILYMGSR